MNKSKPVRMCVSCKIRAEQNLLNRYRVNGGEIKRGKGDGRSFYLCGDCLKKDGKILKKILDRYLKSVSGLEASNLKEKLLNEQC